MLRLRAWNGPKDIYGVMGTSTSVVPSTMIFRGSSLFLEFQGDIAAPQSYQTGGPSTVDSLHYDDSDDETFEEAIRSGRADIASGTLPSAGLNSAGLKQRRQNAVLDMEEGRASPSDQGQWLVAFGHISPTNSSPLRNFQQTEHQDATMQNQVLAQVVEHCSQANSPSDDERSKPNCTID